MVSTERILLAVAGARRGASFRRPGVFTSSITDLHVISNWQSYRQCTDGLFGLLGEDIVKILVEKQEAVRLYLILQELAAGIIGERKSDRVAPSIRVGRGSERHLNRSREGNQHGEERKRRRDHVQNRINNPCVLT